MQSKPLTQLLSVGTATSRLPSIRKIQPPWQSRKEQARPEQTVIFTGEDVRKIIQCIILKGHRYALLKKGLTNQQASQLQSKLYKSSYVVMLRRTLNKMGDQTRLGTGLRGFSLLLLEELERDCWPIVLSELQLLRNQMVERCQKQKLAEIQNAIRREMSKKQLL